MDAADLGTPAMVTPIQVFESRPEQRRAVPEASWVPFVTGRRPNDEALFPRLGSSDHVGLILEDEQEEERANWMHLLFRLENLDDLSEDEVASLEVRVTLSFADPRGDERHPPLHGWSQRAVPLKTFEPDLAGQARLVPARSRGQKPARNFVVAISPNEDLTQRGVPAEPFSLGHLFMQQLRAELLLLRDGSLLSRSEMLVDVCDARRLGTLYKRVMEKVIDPDTAMQAERAGCAYLDPSLHPWFPVLLIGREKTDLYTRALVGDIVYKQRHLTDPRWLLRVGLYLEILTCIGIFEAVRDDLGDLLTPAERHALATSPWLEPIRHALNVEAWRAAWKCRPIALAETGAPRMRGVSAFNLLAKKRATLAFLEAHHEDLKHAIRFAGANDHNAQETWHRVFRDAERAVLRKTARAFPELDGLGSSAREFVLWHRKGRIRGMTLPRSISNWFGDQDGLYAFACNQYRASMNKVSAWARREGLMDFTGDECIPESVSLLQTFMEGDHVRLGQLQRRDGYAGTLDITEAATREVTVSHESVAALLRDVPIFTVLSEEELARLASTIRPIELGPVERIIVQGRKGSSLFVVAEGTLEVLVRQEDGVDVVVARIERGAVFGEMSLLTGAPRSATVRSTDPAVIYEIGQHQIGPILRSNPAAIDKLAALIDARVRADAAAAARHRTREQVRSLASRIRAFVVGP